MNKLFDLIRNPKSLRTYLFIIELKKANDNFIKIGAECFLDFLYTSYRAHGYQVREIRKYKFPDHKIAIDAIKEFHRLHSDFSYTPEHIFPDQEYCYKISLLQYLEYSELITNTEEKDSNDCRIIADNCMKLQDYDKKIKELTLQDVSGKDIALQLHISESKVSRIKKKLQL